MKSVTSLLHTYCYMIHAVLCTESGIVSVALSLEFPLVAVSN